MAPSTTARSARVMRPGFPSGVGSVTIRAIRPVTRRVCSSTGFCSLASPVPEMIVAGGQVERVDHHLGRRADADVLPAQLPHQAAVVALHRVDHQHVRRVRQGQVPADPGADGDRLAPAGRGDDAEHGGVPALVAGEQVEEDGGLVRLGDRRQRPARRAHRGREEGQGEGEAGGVQRAPALQAVRGVEHAGGAEAGGVLPLACWRG